MFATITHFIPIPIIDSSEFTLWSVFNYPPASSAGALRFAEASYVDFFRKSWSENFLRFFHFCFYCLLPCRFSLFHLSYFLSHYFFSFISFLSFFFHFSHCLFSFLSFLFFLFNFSR